MSCFSVGTVEILGQTKWVVNKGKTQVSGPFDKEEDAKAALQEMESILAELMEAAEQGKPVDDNLEAKGTFIGTPELINKYYFRLNTGKRFGIFARWPFDEEKVELVLGRRIDFKITNGQVKMKDNEIDSGRGSTRSR